MATPPQRYYVTEAGKKHWDLLGDPRQMSPEDRQARENLRASMGDWDWAKQQISTQFPHEFEYGVRVLRSALAVADAADCGLTVAKILKVWQSVYKPGENYYEIVTNHCQELVDEMVADGWLITEEALAEQTKAKAAKFEDMVAWREVMINQNLRVVWTDGEPPTFDELLRSLPSEGGVHVRISKYVDLVVTGILTVPLNLPRRVKLDDEGVEGVYPVRVRGRFILNLMNECVPWDIKFVDAGALATTERGDAAGQ